MKQSKVLLISVFITAVVLVIVGAVTSIAMASRNPTPGTAETIQTYQQREAEYQKLIEQANQQLSEANAKLQAVQNQANPSQGAAQNGSAGQPSASPASVAISTDKAEQIARQAADPASLLQKKPELISFEGKAAYEIIFQKGSIYVDAQTGDVLFNGTVPQQITAEKAAQIASDYLQNKDILSVDQITFRNAPLFRVIFKNGMMVYLDTTGQITYMLKSSPKLVDNSTGGGGGGGGGAPSGFHEDNGGND